MELPTLPEINVSVSNLATSFAPTVDAYIAQVKELKTEFASKTVYWNRFKYFLEVPNLILQSVNVMSLVSLFYSHDSTVPQVLSMGTSSCALILTGMIKLFNPRDKVISFTGIRNQLSDLELNLIEARNSGNNQQFNDLQSKVDKLISTLPT